MYMADKLNIFFALCALAIFALFVYVLPMDEGAEEFENRAMGTMPRLTAGTFIRGEFFADFEAYLLDNTAGRTRWLTFAGIVENSYGLNVAGGAQVVVFDAADLGVGLVPDEIFEDLDVTEYGFVQAQGDATEYERVQVVTMGVVNPAAPFSVDVNFHENAVFYLRYTENTTLAARYAEVLNAFAAGVGENVRMFSMIAPVKVEFMGARYAAVNSSQRGTIDFINERLHGDIITVDAHSALAAHADEYIFFRLDHHWTQLGAYYAYLAFAESAGFQPILIENYTEHAISGFVGSLAVGTRNRTILAHPDTIYFYTINDGTTFSINMFTVPSDMAALSYRVFLGGDRDFFYFTSSNENGRTLVVVKDSFANALIPWLAPHYETIVVIDPRQFTGSVLEELENHTAVDLLFINYIPATTMADLIEQIYESI
jgi:hypothetical protein